MQTQIEVYNDNGTLLSTKYENFTPISVDTTVSLTNTEAIELVNQNLLSPGSWYKISGVAPLNTVSEVLYIQAISNNQFAGFGFAKYYNLPVKVEYSAPISQITYMEDSRLNRVGGYNNILNFPWTTDALDNVVDNTSSISVDPAAVLEFKSNRIINGGQLFIDSSSFISLFANNLIQGTAFYLPANLTLNSTIVNNGFVNNVISTCSIDLSNTTYDDFIENVFDRVLSYSIASGTSITQFSRNQFLYASTSDIRCSALTFTDNIVKESTIQILTLSANQIISNSVTQFSSLVIDLPTTISLFQENDFVTSVCQFTNCTIPTFTNNSFIGNYTFVDFSVGGVGVTYNQFHPVTSGLYTGYLEGTIGGGMSFNRILNAAIYTGPGQPIAVSGLIDYNTVEEGTVNLTGSTLGSFTNNNLKNSNINISSTLNTTTFIANNINNVGSISFSNDTSLIQCLLDGNNSINADLNTGRTYQNCTYKQMEYSTFWEEYDLSNPLVFSTGIFYIPSNHSDIIGIFSLKNAPGSTAISTISGNPVYHKFKFVCANNSFDITNAGNIGIEKIQYLNYGGTITLGVTAANTDFAEFDARPVPFGPATIILVDTCILQ